jgi:hypothetical protein
MSEQQPDVRWAPIPPKPNNRGRIWLIVGLSVLALVIVGALLFFLLPRGDAPEPGATASPTASATTAPPTEPAEPEPSAPVETPPPAADPSIDQFRDQVSVWLASAPTGLDIVSETSGDEALGVVGTLQEDAQRLGEAPAPSSIVTAWSDAASAYAQSLVELRSAVGSGSGVQAAITSARSAAQNLAGIVGL